MATPGGECRLPDGRALAYAVYGDPQGATFFYCHGFPGSRLEAALHLDAARRAGVRLIAPDRPGMGRSTPKPDRRLAEWPADLANLADHLGVERFGLVGASCGGPYAAACAALLPGRARSLALLASVAPFREPGLTRGQLAPLRLLFGLARLGPSFAAPMLALDARALRRAPETAVLRLSKLLSPPDRSLVRGQPEARRAFGEAMREAYGQGVRGAAVEASLLAGDWGFDLAAIAAPTFVFQGGLDRHATPAMGRWLAARVGGARLLEEPGEGHLSMIVNALPTALALSLESAA